MNIAHSVVAVPKKDRPISEDAHAIIVGSSQCVFATVVDGHGFHERRSDVAAFSKFVANQLALQAQRHKDLSDMPAWFEDVQNSVKDRFSERALGAAAACLFVDKAGSLKLAHAGDCRLFCFDAMRTDGTTQLSEDHVPEHPVERGRLSVVCEPSKFSIRTRGADIPLPGFSQKRLHYFEKLYGWSRKSLRYTRGFGHPSFRPAFTHEPDVQEIPFEIGSTHIFALCSDGGTKAVRHVFRELWQNGTADTVGVQELATLANDKLLEGPKCPKHDATIIFFKVFP